MDRAAATLPHLDDHAADAEQRLLEHLLHDHGRARHELDGLPLGAIHELEHFDQSLGLLDVHHSHAAPDLDETGYPHHVRVA